MGLGLSDGFLKSLAALGVHGAMALIILAQVYFMIKVVDLIKEKVVPLAGNHFKHVEDAFKDMNEQTRLHRRATRAHTEAIKNNTAMIESQGKLLRELLKDIDDKRNP